MFEANKDSSTPLMHTDVSHLPRGVFRLKAQVRILQTRLSFLFIWQLGSSEMSWNATEEYFHLNFPLL